MKPMMALCQNSQCGTKLQLPDSTADTPVRCPQCGSALTLPASPSFVVFDLETTGLCSRSCEIIQIAAVRFKNGQPQKEDSFFSYCRPKRSIPSFISSYTGITDRDVCAAPRPIEVLQQFSQFVGDSAIMAHNGHRFDLKFLESTCLTHGVNVRKVQSIDTISFSRKLFGTARGTGHSLDRVIQRLGLTASQYQRHDARGDILALADALSLMWKRLSLDASCTGIPRRQGLLPALSPIASPETAPAIQEENPPYSF